MAHKMIGSNKGPAFLLLLLFISLNLQLLFHTQLPFPFSTATNNLFIVLDSDPLVPGYS